MLVCKWEKLPSAMQKEEIRPYWKKLRKKNFSLFWKRVFDIIVSGLMLLILLPFFLILSLAIVIDSRGPVFYRQERVTQYGKHFRIFKFRSMVNLEEIGMEWKPDAVWDKNFFLIEKFVAENHVLPSLKATDDTEKKCAQWLYNQRKSYRLGYLTESKLKRLAEIGVSEEWLAPQKTPFEKGYIIAKAHYEECGTLDVPTNFQHKSGFWLGSWIDKIRKKKDELTDEQIERLDQIGFVWEQTDNFEERFATAKAYYEIHGCLPLEPKHCKTKAELHICQWLRRQLIKRNEGKLEQERIDRLSAIGMDWLNTNERAWERGYGKAKEYYEVNGNLEVKVSYVCADGYPLGEWLHSQRTHRKRLPKAKLDALVNLGMVGIV